MAATATRAKTTASTKTSSKKASAPSKLSGPKLEVRYSKRMKLQRVYTLVVAMPSKGKRKSDEIDESGALVVVRPVIAGAQVVPSEQRFEMAPGNQISFAVTPLAKGRLPRARVEISAPDHPPETITLPMKVCTQRFALALLVLAWAIPTFMISVTKGSLAPKQGTSLAEHFKSSMNNDLPPVPIFNRGADFLPEGWTDFTLADTTGDFLVTGWGYLDANIVRFPWLPNVVAFGFIFLALVAWVIHRPKRKRLVAIVDIKGGNRSEDAAMLEPI